MIEILKIVGILVVMAVMVAFSLNLSYVLAGAIMLVSVFYGRNFSVVYDFLGALKSLETWELIATFFLVFLLSEIMAETGLLKRMLLALERIVKDTRAVIISIPILIGLVPMPSGAMLSAPFVDEIGSKVKISNERKHIINYWFRHITEYINPIYPGPLLAVSIVGISFFELVKINAPIFVAVFLVGFFMFVAGVRGKKVDGKAGRGDVAHVVNGVWPILLAIIMPVFFNVNIALSLAVSIILIVLLNKVSVKQVAVCARKSLKADIILLIFLVFVFRNVLESSGAITKISAEFVALGIPPITLIIALPMIVGFLTGLTIGPVGLTFPLLMPFFGSDLGLVMVAFVSGYLGILISPVHLCFSVTKEYFKVDYKNLYKMLVPAIICVFLFMLGVYYAGWG